MSAQPEKNFNAEKHLDELSLRTLTWKPSVQRDLATEIVQKILLPPFKCWPDEFTLSSVAADDRHVVGLAWRQLIKAGVIKQTGFYRKATTERRHGSNVFQYQLVSRGRAETFLRRNGVIPKVSEIQSELFCTPAQYPN